MSSPPEVGCRRWLVLAMSFFNIVVNNSINYNVGVLNLAVLDTYDADPLVISWLMALYISVFALTGWFKCLQKCSKYVIVDADIERAESLLTYHTLCR